MLRHAFGEGINTMLNARNSSDGFADKIDMQNRLFAELSGMFGKEVPLYDKSLLVNQVCNRAVCDLLAHLHQGFSVTDRQLDKTGGERHGAIRIGRDDEYRWIGRFFSCFGMEPHNFYDMTSVGTKSQPVIATAFRSVVHPEHRVFSSVLRTDYFDDRTRARVDELLSRRQVFSDVAKSLIERSEQQGGLSWDDADALIAQATGRIFKWTGRATDHALYKHLCDSGFKIAADIACFEAHHLNHLTPNTFCIDLYTSSMKFCLGEIDEREFRARASGALAHVERAGDRDFLRLCFKHLSREEIVGFGPGSVPPGAVQELIDGLVERFARSDLQLSQLPHAGFKDFTEGPATGTPVLLRQDAYKALTEPVRFVDSDGTAIDTVHTARFGEIEQRFYATTPEGRELYDRCLAAADAERDRDPGLAKRDFAAHQAAQTRQFTAFPTSLAELVEQNLVYAHYQPTAKGLAARGLIETVDLRRLARDGLIAFDGLRYEDFLPVSAAGIFASNLNQYGTGSSAAVKPTYTKAMLEEILGKNVVESDTIYRGLQADSLLSTFAELGLTGRLDAVQLAKWEADAAMCPASASQQFAERSVVAARA